MTERNTTTEREGPATLGELSHTNPYTGASFGDAMVFDRGPVIAADGGTRTPTDDGDEHASADDGDEHASDGNGDERASDDDAAQTAKDRLKDIDHTPPVGDGANRVHERGGEHSDDEPV